MKNAMISIIKKDFKGVTDNKRLFTALLVVPLVMAVFLPALYLCLIHFLPEDADIQMLLELIPHTSENWELDAAGLVINQFMPMMFLMIPIMASSVTAAGSFVGEKEKRTLETLLYCPLTVKEIFQAKVLASFLLSMMVSLLSFAAMLVVSQGLCMFLAGGFLTPGVGWLVILLLICPAISLIAVTLIVRKSAKAQTMEESQQSAVFLVLPIVAVAGAQFTGAFLLNGWMLLALGVVCAVLAVVLLKSCLRKFTYEMLLR